MLPRLITAHLPSANTHFLGIVSGAAAYLQGSSDWALDVLAASKFSGSVAGRIEACFRPRPLADRIPTVNVSNSQKDSGLPTVVSDDVAVGEMAARFFVEQGLQHFAVFAPCASHYSRLRTEGFVSSLARSGHTTHLLGALGLFDSMSAAEVEGNLEQMRRLLAGLPRPCAIFVVDDLRAALLCRIALGIGYRIPQDFLILGVDDNRMICDSSPVPLSSVALDSRGIGYRAAELLVGILQQNPSLAHCSVPPRFELPPLKVIERASTQTGVRRDPLVARALFLIESEFSHPLRVETLAQRLGVSSRYLQQRFKKALGCSPQQTLLNRRLKEAKTLLRDTGLSITEVAYASGFSDYKQMAHHLRRDAGQTARQLRNVCGETV